MEKAGYDARTVGSDAVAALTNINVPLRERKARLERLAREFPFDGKVDKPDDSTAKYIGHTVAGCWSR